MSAQLQQVNPVGAPTKYTPELLNQINHYIDNYQDYDDVIPSIAGLTQVVDITSQTLNVWRKEEDKKVLSDMLDRLLRSQERVLLNKGLTSAFNSNITKLVLCKHGYHDKQEVTGTITVTKIERVIIDSPGVTLEHEG